MVVREIMLPTDDLWALLERKGYSVSQPTVGQEFMRLLEGKQGPPINYVPPDSHNVRLITNGQQRCFLYVRGSTSEKGFWGPSVNVLRSLSDQETPYVVVLLHESESSGYWFEADQVKIALAKHNWRKDADGDAYRINAPNDVTDGEKFCTESELLHLLEEFIPSSS